MFKSAVGREIFYNGKLLGKITHWDGSHYILTQVNGFEVVIPKQFVSECIEEFRPEPFMGFTKEELDF